MSVTVEIKRTVEVRVYEVACEMPNHGSVEFHAWSDSDGDLYVTVSPCEACLSEAVDDANNLGEKSE